MDAWIAIQLEASRAFASVGGFGGRGGEGVCVWY